MGHKTLNHVEAVSKTKSKLTAFSKQVSFSEWMYMAPFSDMWIVTVGNALLSLPVVASPTESVWFTCLWQPSLNPENQNNGNGWELPSVYDLGAMLDLRGLLTAHHWQILGGRSLILRCWAWVWHGLTSAATRPSCPSGLLQQLAKSGEAFFMC